MGRLADALRDNLRAIARSDARSLGAMDAELKAASTAATPSLSPPPRPASELRQLTNKDELVALVLSGSPSGTSAPALEPGLARLEARWHRLERLAVAIGRQVGLAQEELSRILEGEADREVVA
jgi:hypothetical protein